MSESRRACSGGRGNDGLMAPFPKSIDVDGTLVLRCWDVEDEPILSALVADNVDHLRGYMPWIADEPLAAPKRVELISLWEQQRQAGTDVLYGMWVDGEPAGGCGLHDRVGGIGREIGYWVSRRYLGRGLARRAAEAVTTAGFAVDPSVEFIEIHHNETNVQSRRVPEQLGYRECGETTVTRALAPAETARECIWRVTRQEWAAHHP